MLPVLLPQRLLVLLRPVALVAELRPEPALVLPVPHRLVPDADEPA